MSVTMDHIYGMHVTPMVEEFGTCHICGNETAEPSGDCCTKRICAECSSLGMGSITRCTACNGRVCPFYSCSQPVNRMTVGQICNDCHNGRECIPMCI